VLLEIEERVSDELAECLRALPQSTPDDEERAGDPKLLVKRSCRLKELARYHWIGMLDVISDEKRGHDDLPVSVERSPGATRAVV